MLDDDGAFVEPVDLTAGILVLGDEILGIEFFRYNEGGE